LRGGAGDEAAGRGDPLGEGAGEDIDPAGVDALGLAGAAAGLADGAEGMGLIDEEEGAVLLLELDDPGEAGLVAVHAEDAVHGDEDALDALVAGLTEPALQVLQVVVPEGADLAAGHAAAVLDAAVGVLVQDRPVAGAEEGGDDAHVGVVAGAEDGGGVGAEERGQLPLELVVELEGAGEEADAAGGGAIAAHGLFHGPGQCARRR
jgi:hypothetical protein